jgi:peptidoglycan/xylan/chitin deacetylase (PgdA/CDA1 family)
MLNHKTAKYFFILAFFGLAIVRYFIDFSFVYFLLLVAAWLLLTICGSGLIQWNYFFTSLHSNPILSEEQVSITFDDGPNPIYTSKVLALLAKHKAKATFFCVGKQIEMYPKLFQEIIAAGHTVGNHTFSHSKQFGFFKLRKVVKELKVTDALVKELTGHTLRMYRPAFGVTNPTIMKALQTTHHIAVGWNKRSLDGLPYSENFCYNRVTRNLKKGDIILLHDTSDKSIAVLERLLLFLETKQLQSVTVDTLLKIEPYA